MEPQVEPLDGQRMVKRMKKEMEKMLDKKEKAIEVKLMILNKLCGVGKL